jgi:hypothetical protein
MVQRYIHKVLLQKDFHQLIQVEPVFENRFFVGGGVPGNVLKGISKDPESLF